MPALGAVDPADLRAQARAELGLLRELAQPRPREGGSSGYPVWSREEQLEKWNAGEETAASEEKRPYIDGRTTSSDIVVPAIVRAHRLSVLT